MIDEYITQLAENGLLGILLVIALITIYFLYKENKAKDEKIEEGKNDRIDDLKATLNVNTTFMLEQKESLKNIQALIKESIK